ncbi:hypothetical protein M0R45_032066 [Rubus argutus]|uniref:CAP-Gly domain-containing protein n=1 Tax=Rubus argutus TaxID=59490 RepID=A0AAW1WIE7_RUBAR
MMKPGSVVGDFWSLARGHVFGGQVHNSQEAYEKRNGIFRKFQDKLASQNSSTLKNKIPDNYIEDLCANIKVSRRCEVEPGDKRGGVKFVGRAESIAPGFWVGVQYDEPFGKHDGMQHAVTSPSGYNRTTKAPGEVPEMSRGEVPEMSRGEVPEMSRCELTILSSIVC